MRTSQQTRLSNIRPITISDTISNVFEQFILTRLVHEYNDHELQFGFKKHSSCGHAVYVLKTLAANQKKRRRRLIACAIDASKAFDKVNREKLLTKLMGKVDDSSWLAIKAYYDGSTSRVQTPEQTSEEFQTRCGVIQGGPLSPKLFSIYIEQLIKEVQESGNGIALGQLKFGILAYADDILLLSEKEEEMRKSLRICEEYGAKWDIKWNPQKTQLLLAGDRSKRNRTISTIQFIGQDLVETQELKYLGVDVRNDGKNTTHLSNRRASTIRAAFSLNKVGNEQRDADQFMKGFLYKTYARPVLCYGMENIVMNQKEKDQVRRTEGNLVKRALGLSTRIKTTHLLAAVGIEPILSKLTREKCRFFINLSKNTLTRNLTNHLLKQAPATNKRPVHLVDEIRTYEAAQESHPADQNETGLEQEDICDEYVALLKTCKRTITQRDTENKTIFNSGITHSIKAVINNNKKLLTLLTTPTTTTLNRNDNENELLLG